MSSTETVSSSSLGDHPSFASGNNNEKIETGKDLPKNNYWSPMRIRRTVDEISQNKLAQVIRSRINFCYLFPENMLKEIKIDAIISKEMAKYAREIEECIQLLSITKCHFTSPYTTSCNKNVARNLQCGVSANGKICIQCATIDQKKELEIKVNYLTTKQGNGKY